MKTRIKKLLLVAAILSVLSLTAMGCSGVKGDEVVATFEGEDISVDWVNFFARFQQAESEYMYGSWLGDDMWSSDLYGTGVAYETTVKQNIMSTIQQMLILEKYAPEFDVEVTAEEQEAIKAAAASFLEDNEDKVISRMTASNEAVEQVLSYYTIMAKMSVAMVADVDLEVSDEEAAQKKTNHVFLSFSSKTDDEGNTVEMTDEEKEELYAKAEEILGRVQTGEELEDVVAEVDEELSVTTNTFDDETTSILEDLRTAAAELNEGELAPIIETDSGYYILQLVSEMDEEATETKKESIRSERKEEAYNELYDAWAEECEFTVNESVWNKIKFTNVSYSLKVEETESEDQSGEAADDTDGSGESEEEESGAADETEETDEESDEESTEETDAE